MPSPHHGQVTSAQISIFTTRLQYLRFTSFQANSTGKLNTIERSSVGQYVVHVPVTAQDGAFGHAMATAYGTGAERCSVPQTVGTGPGNVEGALLVDVYCFTPAGVPVDTRFTMTFVRAGNVIGGSVSNGSTGGFPSLYAHVFARNLGQTTKSGAEGDSWYVSDGGTLRVDHLGTGVYAVHSTMDNQLGHGTVHVASMTVQTGFYCKVGIWAPSIGIEVLCFAANGSPLDASFYVDFVGGFISA